MKLKKIETKGSRYAYDDVFSLEVWETEDLAEGRLFEFYLISNKSDYRLYMYGARQYQPAENKLYTKTEMIKMAMENVRLFVDEYNESVEKEQVE